MTYLKNYVSGITYRGASPAHKMMFDTKNIVIPPTFGDGGFHDLKYLRDILVSVVDDMSGMNVSISGLKAANGGVTSAVTLRTFQTIVEPLLPLP